MRCNFLFRFMGALGLLVLQAQTVGAADTGGGVSAFYQWASEVPSTPGTLLRHEPLEEELLLEYAGVGKRILYSSESFSGAVVAVSGAVFLPKGEAPEEGWPVLAWSHGTVGVADICAPSHAGRSPRDVTYLNHWLLRARVCSPPARA